MISLVACTMQAAGHGSQNVPGMVYVEQSATALPPTKQEAVAVTITAGKLEITGLEDYPPSRRERSGKSRPIVPLGPGFRRGGLSMFLRGDLDAGRSTEPGPSQPQPLTPSPSGAVPWRAAESSAAGRNTTTSPVPWSAPSFRDIQLQVSLSADGAPPQLSHQKSLGRFGTREK